MRILDPVLSLTLSDLLINLSAGWWAAVLITPNFSEKKGIAKAIILTVDVIFAILFLVIAVYLRRIK